MTKDEALKRALEALENLFGIPDKWTGEGGGDVAVWRLGGSYRAQQAITAIKEALAQPKQDEQCKRCTDGCPACDARKLPEQEPVAWTSWRELAGARHYRTPGWEMYADKRNPDDVALYTSPPAQRTWVGLTEDEAFACQGRDYFETYKAIEAKLKEKNT